MNTRFYNARILTMTQPLEILEGELWVRGSEIIYVGDGSDVPEIIGPMSWDQEIDVGKNLLMPGFKNAHTHSAMTFLRSYADDLPLAEWLQRQVFPMEAKLTAEDIYHLSKLAILEYLTSGITANFDMYLTPDSIAQASVDMGFRTVQVGGMNNFSQSIEELEEWYLKYQGYHELVSFRLGFHAEYTTSMELLEALAALAGKYQAPVYTHNAETAAEVAECRQRYQCTPTKLLDGLGMFEYGGGGFHCVYLEEEDMEIFQMRGMSIVLNPGSNVKLASGIAPVKDFLERGIDLGLGTDGPASNNCLDMFREMFLATGLAKIREQDAAAVDAGQVLHMATVGGAKAMGLTDCDVLAPGKKADIIMLDLHQPNMQPVNNIIKNIVYSGSKLNVKMTMVNGVVRYMDHRFLVGTPPEEIYRQANAIVERMRG